MNNFLIFASESAQPAEGGLGAFGINWQSILIQAITFLLVVWVLKKYVLGKLYTIIDDREKKINEGLAKADDAKKEYQKAQKDIDKVLGEAREQAELIVSSSKTEASEIVKESEEKATHRAEQIVVDAENKIANSVNKAKKELKVETIKLVSEVSAAILTEKLDAKSDLDLIKRELEKRSVK